MIIDTHVHLIIPGFVRRKFITGNARMASNLYNRVHKTNITPSEYIEKLKARVDPDCSKLIETMDRAGIDKSVIFGVDWAYALTGEPKVSNREQNRIHAEMAKKWEGRFVPLAALGLLGSEAPLHAADQAALDEAGIDAGDLVEERLQRGIPLGALLLVVHLVLYAVSFEVAPVGLRQRVVLRCAGGHHDPARPDLLALAHDAVCGQPDHAGNEGD